MATPSTPAPSPVRAALDTYRTHVAEHNRLTLEVYLPVLANAEFDEGDDDRDIAEVRLESLGTLLGVSVDELARLGITAPLDVLDRYDELVPRLGLDGTDGVHDAKEGASKRREYISGINNALREKSLEEVRETISIPEEFRELTELVDSVVGSGKAYCGVLPMFLEAVVQDNGANFRHRTGAVPRQAANLLLVRI